MKRSQTSPLAGFVIGLMLAPVGLSQSARQKGPAFDAVVIKRAAPGTGMPPAWHPPRDHGRYTLRSASLRVCLQIADRLTPDRISGPKWMDSQRYALIATM